MIKVKIKLLNENAKVPSIVLKYCKLPLLSLTW